MTLSREDAERVLAEWDAGTEYSENVADALRAMLEDGAAWRKAYARAVAEREVAERQRDEARDSRDEARSQLALAMAWGAALSEMASTGLVRLWCDLDNERALRRRAESAVGWQQRALAERDAVLERIECAVASGGDALIVAAIIAAAREREPVREEASRPTKPGDLRWGDAFEANTGDTWELICNESGGRWLCERAGDGLRKSYDVLSLAKAGSWQRARCAAEQSTQPADEDEPSAGDEVVVGEEA